MFEKWKDRRRQIFRFWDGSKFKRMDPAVIEQRITANPDSVLGNDVPLMGMQDKFGQESYDNVLKAVRYIFEVGGVTNQGGLTEMEQLGLLQGYYDFRAKLKKNFSLRPTLLPTPDSTHSNGFPTKPNSEFPSMPTESATVAPKSS